jgi:hypothetical protein
VNHGFVRASNGAIAVFEVPGAETHEAQGTLALSINDTGAVAGYYLDASLLYHGFIRTPDGGIITFDAPGAGTRIYQGTLGMSINTSGAVAGYYYDPGEFHHGFVRAATGAVTTFDDAGAGGTAVYSINAAESIVGDADYLAGPEKRSVAVGYVRAAASGATTSFHVLAADQTVPDAINDWGFIAGYYGVANGSFHGFLVTPNAYRVALPTTR